MSCRALLAGLLLDVLLALALVRNRACLQCLFACALNQYGPGVKLSLRCFLAYKIC